MTTPRTHVRRARILEVTKALIERRGIAAATTRLIAIESGVTEKTIFNLFGTKDKLVAAAASGRSAEVFERALNDPALTGWDALLSIADAIGQISLDRPAIARALAPLLLDPQSGVRVDALYEQYIGPIVHGMIRAGDLRPDTPVDALVRLIRVGIIGWLVAWAGDELDDATLTTHFRLEIGVLLLPFAMEGFAERCRRQTMDEVHSLA